MADVLRATKGVPGFHDALTLHLIEASPSLRQAQADRLSGMSPKWHDSLDTLPQGPLFLIANEFFDALPIRQFQRDGTAWRERLVGLQDARLAVGLSDPMQPGFLAARLEDTRDGDIVETCPLATVFCAEISHRIAAQGGAALFIDYGDWRSLGDTLQALRAHKPVDPFEMPGEADLTAHVDFEALADAASPARYSRVTPQGVFLERLGITARAQTLAGHLGGAALESHIAAHRRLTHPDEMGSVFKAMSLYPPHGAPLPGLDP
jgi:SAM-dependent MidA family methyltransferase